jgi:hypothetical protein
MSQFPPNDGLDGFGAFWAEYLKSLRAEVGAELREALRVAAWFAWAAALAWERAREQGAPPDRP